MFGVVTSVLRGVARPSRIQRGLFAGRNKLFGNKIADDKKSPIKTTRTWDPNVQWKRLHSDVLDRTMRIKVTAHAMRCIDKAGGFDKYILNTPEKNLQSELGMRLKKEMQAAQKANVSK